MTCKDAVRRKMANFPVAVPMVAAVGKPIVFTQKSDRWSLFCVGSLS